MRHESGVERGTLGDDREMCGRRPGDAEGEGKERVARGSRGSETRSWNP